MSAASTVIGIAAIALGVALSVLGAVGAVLWGDEAKAMSRTHISIARRDLHEQLIAAYAAGLVTGSVVVWLLIWWAKS